MHYYIATQTGYQAAQQHQTAPDCWVDCTAQQASQTDAFIDNIHSLTGIKLQHLHVRDAANLLHPSHYDGTPDYDMVVFRSLIGTESKAVGKTKSRSLQVITTQPITFFISDHALITVQHSDKSNIAQVLSRLNKACNPHELMLRFLNAQVDTYLALRQPLTEQLDRWQRELLDPRRSFNDWTALLDARLELRKLEALSEEQLDALQELREAWAEPHALPYSLDIKADLRVRLADVMEHIGRVLNHARRLENSVESAIQLHFAAVSHTTNKIVSNLTVLTAIFAPLTLLTGFYGMNVPLPWQEHKTAFMWILSAMCGLAVMMLLTVGGVRLWRNRRRQP